MAKIGLAAELAKQAAQAAREEMTGGAASAAKSPPSIWKPSELPLTFNVDQALGRAVTQVAAHYSKILAPEGLGMAVVTDTTQGVPALQADLREGGTGRVVRAYTAPDLLGMFAAQQKLNGVVVDGQV